MYSWRGRGRAGVSLAWGAWRLQESTPQPPNIRKI